MAKPNVRTKPTIYARLRMIAMFCLWLIIVVMSASADEPSLDISDAYEMVAENDHFQLYVDDSTLAFKLLDKRSNYLWHSGLDEVLEDDRLNTSWQAFAKSGISIEYLDNRAVNKRVTIDNETDSLEVTLVEQGISADVTFEAYGITLRIMLRLENEGIRVEVPADSISESNPDFRLGKIYLYPFLGATRGDSMPGYMLLPDGVGSLVHFAETTKATNMFYGRYYGPDLGMIAVQPYDGDVKAPSPLSLPVFGLAHTEQQSAFLSVVEEGAAYGEVQMHPSGIITNFNFIHNAFIYNQTYFQATNRSGAGVNTVQRQRNDFDVIVHYRFLTGDMADYVGMARSYQDYLVENDQLHSDEANESEIGIRLEFLGGDKEQVLFWDRFVSMTTITQMRDILQALQIPNSDVIYYGWQPYGATSVTPPSLMLEGSLGSLQELNELAQGIQQDGGHFSLYYEPQAATWGQSGYSSRNDLAMAITNVALAGYNRLYYYYFTIDVLRERYNALTADIANQLDAGLALDSIGSTLYSDFRETTRLNRQATIAAYQDVLAGAPLRLTFYRPNDYLLGLAQAYYDMPLSDNGYIYTTQTVPFLPIVLSGYIPYYGPALNFSSNLENDLLKHVEYGIYPSYFLTHEPTAKMLNTRSSWIYTSSFEQWGEQIQSTYQWMNDLLGPICGQAIIAHEELAEGIFATTYDNGNQIIVNYTDSPFAYRGSTVEARDALHMEDGR